MGKTIHNISFFYLLNFFNVVYFLYNISNMSKEIYRLTNFNFMAINSKKSLHKLGNEVTNCQKCKDLASTRLQAVPGSGAANAIVIIVGSHPDAAGAEKKGIPFAGDDAGKLIRGILTETDLSLEKDIYATYLTKCTSRALQKSSSGETAVPAGPQKKHISNCISYLTKERSIIFPHIIVSLGLDVSNIILNKFFSVDKKYRNMEKIHMRMFENPSFKLVPFFSPYDVTAKSIVTREKYQEDFNSLAKLLKKV